MRRPFVLLTSVFAVATTACSLVVRCADGSMLLPYRRSAACELPVLTRSLLTPQRGIEPILFATVAMVAMLCRLPLRFCFHRTRGASPLHAVSDFSAGVGSAYLPRPVERWPRRCGGLAAICWCRRGLGPAPPACSLWSLNTRRGSAVGLLVRGRCTSHPAHTSLGVCAASGYHCIMQLALLPSGHNAICLRPSR